MTEQWIPIEESNGWYDVSNLGRVRRMYPGINTHVGRMLRFSKVGRKPKYYIAAMSLRQKGHCLRIKVHQLVAKYFIGPCPEGHEINHIDGNSLNNHVTNLEYVSHKENVQHAFINGLMKTPRYGEYNPRSRLTENDVKVIRQSRESLSVLMRRYGVGKSTIHNVRHHLTWKHID